MYTVYIHRFPNGYTYVGQTSKKPQSRFGNNGIGYRNNERMYAAIKRYGWDNIQHEIVAENLCEKDALKLERELIARQKKTYNKDKGGRSRKTYFCPEIVIITQNAVKYHDFKEYNKLFKELGKDRIKAATVNLGFLLACRRKEWKDQFYDEQGRPCSGYEPLFAFILLIEEFANSVNEIDRAMFEIFDSNIPSPSELIAGRKAKIYNLRRNETI